MNKKKGEIFLTELERSPMDIEFDSKDSENSPWAKNSLEGAAPKGLLEGVSESEWADRCELSGKLHLERLGGEYMLAGSLEAKVEAVCSRCGDFFPAERKSDFKLFFEPPEKRQRKQKLDDGGDPDYIVLEEDKIVVTDIVSEQLVVLEPLAECPDRKSDGSCLFCGKNPQYTGQLNEKGEESGPFSKLKDLARSE